MKRLSRKVFESLFPETFKKAMLGEEVFKISYEHHFYTIRLFYGKLQIRLVK